MHKKDIRGVAPAVWVEPNVFLNGSLQGDMKEKGEHFRTGSTAKSVNEGKQM